MAIFRLSRQYRRLSDANLLTFASFIHQQISAETTVFPTPSPGMIALNDAIEEFRSAKTNAGDGSRLLIREKNVQRKALVALLDQLCNYVMFIAAGDPEVAAKAGFPFTKQPEPTVMNVPTNLTVNAGKQTGEIEISVAKVQHAASYLHQYSTDPLLQEANWMTMSCTQCKCTITDLEPGVKYFFRVGAVGAKEQVLYSIVVSRVAA